LDSRGRKREVDSIECKKDKGNPLRTGGRIFERVIMNSVMRSA
jgi:hypothetical protein